MSSESQDVKLTENYSGKTFAVKAEFLGKSLEFSSKILNVSCIDDELKYVTIEFENGCEACIKADNYEFSENSIKGKYFAISIPEDYRIIEELGFETIDSIKYGANIKPEVEIKMTLEDAVIRFKSKHDWTAKPNLASRKDEQLRRITYSNGCILTMNSKELDSIESIGETEDYVLSLTKFVTKKQI